MSDRANLLQLDEHDPGALPGFLVSFVLILRRYMEFENAITSTMSAGWRELGEFESQGGSTRAVNAEFVNTSGPCSKRACAAVSGRRGSCSGQMNHRAAGEPSRSSVRQFTISWIGGTAGS